MDTRALRGSNAFVTGAGSGIGRALVLELASLGVDVTAADIDFAGAQATAGVANGGNVTAVRLDVTSPEAQEAAIKAHVTRHGSLDISVLNAGIGERTELLTARDGSWRPTLDVDLTAVLDGIRLSAQAMAPDGGRRAKQGVIITVASAGAFFIIPPAPVYAAAKAGLAHATRSLARPLLERYNVRIAALCPEFVDTPLVQKNVRQEQGDNSEFGRATRMPLLTVDKVIEAAMILIADRNRVGQCLVVRLTGDWMEALPGGKCLKYITKPVAVAKASPGGIDWAAGGLERAGYQSKSIIVHTLSNDFRAATRLETVHVSATIPEGHVILRTVYAGINASDVNYSSGRYHATVAEARAALPYPAGFEAVSVVAAVGPGVRGYEVGQPVACMVAGSFSEFAVVPAKALFRIPGPRPEYLAMLTSGLTSSIGLQEAGRLRKGETVLVTAAAGGAGQFAVQLAKLAGCHVIATVGSDSKARLIKSLGANRAINYRTEDLKKVLRSEYPKGIDVVWETVGAEMFTTCLNALAPGGRLIVIGAMSQYKKAGGWKPQAHVGLPEKLLARSATVTGFFLPKYGHLFKEHLGRLIQMHAEGKLKVVMDEKTFEGVVQVPDAVDRLQSGQSAGKVFIRIASEGPPAPQAKL